MEHVWKLARLHRLFTPRRVHGMGTCCGLVLLGTLALAGTGCSRPLLAPSEERSPFDRYDAVRGDYAPQFVEDKFGRRQPNLRGRLTPKD